MSRDSNYTYIHTHASHHADLFEEFCHPPSSTPTTQHNNTANNATQNASNDMTADPGMVQIPGHFLPFEEIQLPPHLMPLNPEDEDDVVPDMHAAFGIQRALGQGGVAAPDATGEAGARGSQREPIWRDLGMERLLENGGLNGGRVESGGTAGGIARRREGITSHEMERDKASKSQDKDYGTELHGFPSLCRAGNVTDFFTYEQRTFWD